MKKTTSVYSVIMVCAAALLVLTLCFAASETAYADDFNIVYPSENYIQAATPSYIAAGSNYVVVYDKASDSLIAEGDKSLCIPLASQEKVAGIWLAETTVLIKYDTTPFTYASVDLAADIAAPIAADLPTPEDIEYIASDGNLIYAKSTAFLSVYDKNLNAIYSDITHKYLVGELIIVGDGTTVYAFSQSYGDPVFNTYNLATKAGTSIKASDDVLPRRAAMGTTYIYTISGGRLSALSKSNGSKVFDAQLTVNENTEFAAYGDTLYLIDGKTNSIMIYSLNASKTGLTYVKTLSMKGSLGTQLDEPSDIVFRGNNMYIADSNNKRIIIKGEQSVSSVALPEKPVSLAASARGIYAVSAHSIFFAESNSAGLQVSDDDWNILDIIYKDNLYILTDNGLYVLSGNTPVLVMSVADALALGAAEDGAFLYVMTRTGVLTLSANGKEILPERPCDFSSAIDFDVDYQGNFYVLNETEITVYENALDGVVFIRSIALTSPYLSANPTSIALKNSYAYFSTEESFIGQTIVQSISKADFTPTPDPGLEAVSTVIPYYFAKASGADAPIYFFTEPKRLDTMTVHGGEEIFVVFDFDGAAPDGFKYVYYNGAYGYIADKNILDAAPTAYSVDYCTVTDATAHKNPFIPGGSGSIIIPQGTKFRLIDDAAGVENNKWWHISYGGNSYYVLRSETKNYVEDVPEANKQFGKAKAERVGGTVNIYTLPDTNSEVLSSVVDGSKVEILDKLGDFYLVKHDGVIGYIEKDEIVLQGLTTVQIIAIVLSVIVLLAGAVIFAVSYYTRKKQEQ